MKLFIFYFTVAVFIIGCTENTMDQSSVIPAEPTVESGTGVFTFDGDTAYTLVFIDSVQRMASVHSLNKSCGQSKANEYIKLSAIEEEADVAKLRTLLDSESQYVFIFKLRDSAIGEICCRTMQQADLVMSGTGQIEYSYFGWGDPKEEAGDSLYIPKITGDDFFIRGVGTVTDLENGNSYDYNSSCCVCLDLLEGEEQHLQTEISIR
jgi:hypothetical protein